MTFLAWYIDLNGIESKINVYQINHFEIKLWYFLTSHERQHVNGNLSKLYLLLLLPMRESGDGGNHFHSSSCHKQHGCCALGASSNALQRAWMLCGSCWAAHLMQLFWEWECYFDHYHASYQPWYLSLSLGLLWIDMTKVCVLVVGVFECVEGREGLGRLI